jgi:hypothetical protein
MVKGGMVGVKIVGLVGKRVEEEVGLGSGVVI